MQLSDKSDCFTQLVSIAVNGQTARGKEEKTPPGTTPDILSTNHFTVWLVNKDIILLRSCSLTWWERWCFHSAVSRFNGCVFILRPVLYVFDEMSKCPQLDTAVGTVVGTNSMQLNVKRPEMGSLKTKYKLDCMY